MNKGHPDKQDEIFIVVNRSDRIIGYRSRFECHHNKQLIHRAVGVVIFNEQSQILLQKRSKYKDTDPGLYTLSATGHVDKGETYQQAAQRELMEELGIKTALKKEKKYLAETAEETEMDCLFTAKHNGPFYPNKNEIDKLQFVDIIKLKELSAELAPFAALSLKQLSLL